MKKTHIVLLVLMVIGIAAIASTFVDFSTYETFASASTKPGKTFPVYGYIQKDSIMKSPDPNHFVFYAKDKAGNVKQVILNNDKPRDIEKSEWIVMTGFDQDGVFHCSKINMKCPSKYKKEMVTVGKDA